MNMTGNLPTAGQLPACRLWPPGFTPVPVRVGFVLTKWHWYRFFS